MQYVKTGQSSQSINVKDFINDMISRGYIQPSWYLHVWEAGFEIMSGGAGLTANSFSFSVSGGGGGGATNPPSATPAPTNPPSGGNCGTCNWYGTNYPLCCTTTSGWGWENNQSCISQSTCNSQGGGSGTVTPAPTNPPSGGGIVTPAPTNPPSGGGGSASGCTCPAGCGSQVAISSSYSKDGAGEFCFVASSLGSYLNSWNLDSLIVNGSNCRNRYTSVSGIPKNSDGKYYIYYKGSFSWSHFEAR